MNNFIFLFSLIISIAGILLAFRAGYNAGKGHDHLISDPDMDIPINVEESVQALTHAEIMEDMEHSRKTMQGYDLE